MHCSNCSTTIEKHFKKQEGIDVTIILSENEGIFLYEDNLWDEKKIEKELKSIGYPKTKNNTFKFDNIRLTICIILTIPFFLHMLLMGLGIHFGPFFNYVQLILACLVELFAGIPFFIGMIRDFKNKRLGMDVLVTLGTLTAFIYSLIIMFTNHHETLYFETCAMLLTIIMIGKHFEKKAKIKTSSALKELMSLQEKTAKVLKNNKVIDKNIEDIEIDDIIIIPKMSNIPLDGIVVEGLSTVDESLLTGESMPVIVSKNSKVYAGTMLLSESIKIKVIKTSSETYLSSLINKVEQIQANKPRIQKIADKIASIFVPCVIIISLLCLLITFLISNDFELSLKRSIAVLMISCPCSLGLATPLSILVGSSRAIKMGIIYNNTEIFEKASKINAICFDKTGTLTSGKFEVISYETFDENALNIIYTMESNSTHPIAKSLVCYCKKNNATFIEDLKVNEIIGKGIMANDYFIYKENRNIHLTKNNEIIATLKVKDEVKENAKELINSLTKQNIVVYIFTGDNKDVALETANELNVKIENVFYEVKPEDKLSLIEKLINEGKVVAFVGDGINDALALNKAELSISMGSGSDVAKSSSDITLANNDLTCLSNSILLSKKVYFNIIQNFIWAFSYNLIAIPLAFCGILSPMLSGLFMAFSSITVVFNALRLHNVKLNKEDSHDIK